MEELRKRAFGLLEEARQAIDCYNSLVWLISNGYVFEDDEGFLNVTDKAKSADFDFIAHQIKEQNNLI